MVHEIWGTAHTILDESQVCSLMYYKLISITECEDDSGFDGYTIGEKVHFVHCISFNFYVEV